MPKTKKLDSKLIQYWGSMKDIINSEFSRFNADVYAKRSKMAEQYLKLQKKNERTEKEEKTYQKLQKELHGNKNIVTNDKFNSFYQYMHKLAEINEREDTKVTLAELKELKKRLFDTNVLYSLEYVDEKSEKAKKIGFKADIPTRKYINNIYHQLRNADYYALNRAIEHCEKNKLDAIEATEIFKGDHIVGETLVEKGISEENGNLNKFENLKKKINNLYNEMEQADSPVHKDSKEYKAMKNALAALNSFLDKDGEKDANGKRVLNEDEILEIGDKLQALSDAAGNYIKAKGMSTPYTKLGKDRMAVASKIFAAVNYADGNNIYNDFNGNTRNVFPSASRYKEYLDEKSRKDIEEIKNNMNLEEPEEENEI